MASLISLNTLAALNPSYWDLFGRAENKALLEQVEQLKAELQRAQEDNVSLETHNKELFETNMVQQTTIQQLTTNTTNLEAQMQQMSQNAASQEAKIQELSANTASQDAEIQELSVDLRSEEEENKTLWGQIKYLTTELGNSKKSIIDWKDMYYREKDLHTGNRQQMMDLENELNAMIQQLQAEQNLRGRMVADEKRLKRKFNKLQEKYEQLQKAQETLLREQEQQQPQKEMWSLQQSVFEQTELIKSLLAEQHRMSNTIMLMTEAAAETERSFQQEIEELKHELHIQSSPAEDHSVQPDNVHLMEHVDSPNQELEQMQPWAEEQSDLLNKHEALYHTERRRRRRPHRQLKKARKQLQTELKLDTLNQLETLSYESIPQNSTTETHPDKPPASGCKQEKQTNTAQEKNKKRRRRRTNKEPSR